MPADALIVGVVLVQRLPQLVGEGVLGRLARLGLVRRDGDRQPLLARLRRGHRRRAGRDGDRLQRAASAARLPLVGRNRPPADPEREPARTAGTVPPVSRAAAIKHGYTTGARRLASRSVTGLTRTRVTPNALTASGVTLCAAASVLVLFEGRNELLFYWLAALVFVVGSLLDILDGALARAGGKTTPFGAFLDSTTDRVSEGFMLTAIAYVLARTTIRSSSPSRWPRSRARSSSPTRARRPRRSACAATSASARAPSASSSSPQVSSSHRGACCPWSLVLLACTAWITVGQRVLHVRKQLMEASNVSEING